VILIRGAIEVARRGQTLSQRDSCAPAGRPHSTPTRRSRRAGQKGKKPQTRSETRGLVPRPDRHSAHGHGPSHPAGDDPSPR
jgi:hypothetical protein